MDFSILYLNVISCGRKSEMTIQKSSKKDTIYNPIPNDSECNSRITGYYDKYGVVISNFYPYSNIKTFDYYLDGNKDSLVILRPFYSNNNDLENSCEITKNDKVLLISKVVNSKVIKTDKFYNILSNNSFFLGSKEIKTYKNNFSISGNWGHSNKFYSDIYISAKRDNFYVDSIRIESDGKYQYSKSYQIKMKIGDFNRMILDSLRMLNEK